MGRESPDQVVERVVEAAAAALAAYVPRYQDELVVVAVSGGVDSMVLLDVLMRLRSSLRLSLHVAHLDHGLRAESAADRRFVQDYARERHLPCTCARRRAGVYARRSSRSLEDAAREMRYAFLDEVAVSLGVRYVMLGHQADDQAETVLLRLLRGSGATGLAGMRVVRDQRYVRPLLSVERKTIELYASVAHIPFQEDASNLDVRHARNRVRHELLPQLRRYNPRVCTVLGRTAGLLGDEDDCLEQMALTASSEVLVPGPVPGLDAGKLALDVPRLVEYHIAVQRRIVRALMVGLGGGIPAPGFADLEAVVQMVATSSRGVRTLSGGLVVQRSGNWLIVGRTGAAPVECTVPVPGEVLVADRSVALRTRVCRCTDLPRLGPVDGIKCAAFDHARVGTRLFLRGLRPGDRFRPHGMEGHKKLSDFLVDIKWPRLLRQGLLVLTTEDGVIVWVVGLRPAHQFRVTPATRAVVVMELSSSAPVR